MVVDAIVSVDSGCADPCSFDCAFLDDGSEMEGFVTRDLLLKESVGCDGWADRVALDLRLGGIVFGVIGVGYDNGRTDPTENFGLCMSDLL